MKNLTKYSYLLILVLLLTVALQTASQVRADTLTKIFWGDATLSRIQLRDIGGGIPSNLLSSATNVKGIVLDSADQKLYWVNSGDGKIERSSLNGDSRENVVTGLVDPHDLALDLTRNLIYWTDPGSGLVQRCSLTSLPCLPQTVTNSPKPLGIALDTTTNELYWADDTAANPRIRRCSPASCTPADVLTGLGSVGDIALDVAAGKIYWVDHVNGEIGRDNLTGGAPETLYTLARPVTLGCLALDLKDGYNLYWTESSGSSGLIKRANLNGTGPTDIVTGLGNPFGLALYFFPPEIRVQGNGTEIANGDTEPSLDDHTDFGEADRVSGSITRTFTIQALEGGALHLTGSPSLISIEGDHATDFQVTAQPASLLTGGSSTTFDVLFDPSALGPRTATISIANDDPDENPYTFAIRGEGTCPSTIVVTSDADSGTGSLRQAVDRVCDGGIITFSEDYLIRLDDQIQIGGKAVTIDGSGRSVTINGDSDGNDLPDTRLFLVSTTGVATFTHLNLVNGGWTNNYGGAIRNWGGTVTIDNCTITGSQALSGAALHNEGQMTVSNTTFSDNSATQDGGGIHNLGTLTINSSTLSDNSAALGGGISNNGGSVTLQNTLVAGNSTGSGGPDLAGTITSNDYNLIQDISGATITLQAHDLTGRDPHLAPLGDYGGHQATYALLPGSPAIDAGANCPLTDQRSVNRPQAGSCDIGAFESRGFSLTATGGSNQSQFVNLSFPTPLQVEVVSNAVGEPVGPGGRINFNGPGSGASLNPAANTAATDAGGKASLSITANGTAGKYQVTAAAAGAASPVSFSLTNVADTIIINELDTDQGGSDNAEFIELYDGGAGNTSLADLVLVFYNADLGDASYRAIDLDEHLTNPGGYFVICGNTATVPACDLDITPNTDFMEDGADAVALYLGSAAGFPNGTAVTTINLVDALVYDTDDADDPGLLILLNAGQPQVNENGNSHSPTESNQRCPNGTGGARYTHTFYQQPPTPGSENSCIPTVEFTQVNYNIGEAAGTTPLVTLSRRGYIANSSTVQVSVRGGTATGGMDYTDDFTRTVIFNSNQVSATVTVVITDDTMYELPESIIFEVTPVTNAAIGSQRETALTINDNDSQPTVSLALSGSPLIEAGGVATVTANLSNLSYQAVTVNLDLTGSASGSDYTPSGTAITIPAGNLSGSITLTGQNDDLDEPTETIVVDISTVINAAEEEFQQVTATITDDDLPPTVSFTQASSSGDEDGDNIIVTIQLSAISAYDISIPFSLSGSAITGNDYTIVTASPLTIPAELLSTAIPIDPIADNRYELDETLIITLGPPIHAGLGTTTQHTVTINDNDSQPTVSLALTGSPLIEAGGVATVTANLSNPSYQTVTVNLDLTGSASGSDYTPSGTAITIPAGDLSGSITLTGQDDDLDEPTETIVVDINTVINAAEEEFQQVTATITDDDERGVTVDPTSGLITGEDGRQATFTVVLNSEPTAEVTLDLVSDTPAEGTVSPAQLIFTPDNWDQPQTVTVTGTDDDPPVVDGPSVYHIQVLAAVGGDYTGINPDDIQLTNEDNDTPGIEINPVSITVSEPADSAVFTISLKTQPLNGAEVTIGLSTGNAQCSLSLTSATIVTANWRIGIPITVTAVDDDIVDGNQDCAVLTADPVSPDPDYNGPAANPANVMVTVKDDDTAGVEVVPTSLTLSEPDGNGVFTISLQSEPTAPVQVNLSNDSPGECLVPASVTLNAGNWRTGLPVTVTVQDDDDMDGTQTCTISGAASSRDRDYNAIVIASVTVRVEDDERNSVYLPLLTSDFRTMPDLVIVPDSLQATGSSVTLEIRNDGNVPVENAFWVDVYFNPGQIPALNKPWDTIAPAGAVWGVTRSLAPGETLVLTRGGDYYLPGASSNGFPVGAQVYALVDSINYDTNYGNVQESNEGNNLAGPVISGQAQRSTAAGQNQAPALSRLPER